MSSSLLTIGNKLPLYVAAAGSGKKQGIIVIQEWWGLNDQIKAITDRIAVAGDGFKAVAPDL
jgi:carboxymethylenebutenolidase